MNTRVLKLVVIAFFLSAVFVYFTELIPDSVVKGQTSGSALSVPTNVTASDNAYHNKVGLNWETIKGATTYRIFRSISNNQSTANDVGTTVANYFFDTTAVAGQNYFYWVRAENGSNVSGLSVSDQGVRANGNLIPGAFNVLNPPNAPSGNEVTAAKATLGKTLFWDEQLSSTRTVACGTCHQSNSGGSDPRTRANVMSSINPGPDNTFTTPDDIFGSQGVPINNADGTYNFSSIYGLKNQVTPRKAPSYLNAGYSPNGLFWDGRALDTFRDPITNAIILGSGASLESQVLGPPVNSGEMAHGGRNWTDVANRISASKPLALAAEVPAGLKNWINNRTYPELFAEAFGTSEVTPARIAMAIATHERTLFSDQTPLDKSITQIQPLQGQEELGRQLFVQLQCNVCHDGALLTDHIFHNIGVRPQSDDPGRFAISNNAEDLSAFKTPPLRNVELHAPYMHNGRFQTLEEVVEFYNRGGDFDAPNIDHGNIRPLNLTSEEKASLVAFMKRPLTDERVRNELPPFDKPKLYTESVRVPQIFGTGRIGSGGQIPQVTAIEPPFVGNPSFTVAVSNALGGSQAVLAIDSNDPGTSAIPANASFARLNMQLSGTGAGNGFGSFSISIPTNPALIGQTFIGRWYVTDVGAANGFSYSQPFKFTVFSQATNISKPRTDFDGDGKADISIFRRSVGEWWYLRSSDGNNRAFQFGVSTDKIVPADYTGDGKTDIAIFRPSSGEWFILRSEDSSFYSFPFGNSSDIPVPGDFDSDGKADPTVFRTSNSTWYTNASAQGFLIRSFGITGDIPQVGDYDGDGRADLAIFRPNGAHGAEWWINRSSQGTFVAQFGLATDKPVIGDYTGDGKTDIAFFRPSSGEWFILRSEDSSFYSVPFGISNDIPAPGDYDGDGKSDLGIFRQSNTTWYLNNSRNGFQIIGFGIGEDYPIASAYIP
jgi:cytochrome c peroxidase